LYRFSSFSPPSASPYTNAFTVIPANNTIQYLQTHHPTKHRHRLKSGLFMHITNLKVYDLNWTVQHVHKQIGWTCNACMKEFQIRKWQKEKMPCQVWLLLVLPQLLVQALIPKLGPSLTKSHKPIEASVINTSM
jgi:hypothetical protein